MDEIFAQEMHDATLFARERHCLTNDLDEITTKPSDDDFNRPDDFGRNICSRPGNATDSCLDGGKPNRCSTLQDMPSTGISRHKQTYECGGANCPKHPNYKR
jgi:hypothetical protein